MPEAAQLSDGQLCELLQRHFGIQAAQAFAQPPPAPAGGSGKSKAAAAAAAAKHTLGSHAASMPVSLEHAAEVGQVT